MDIQTAQSIVNPKYTLESLLASEKFQRNLGAVLNKEGQAERFIQIALNTLSRQPQLKECTQASFFDALLKLSQIGLDPDGYHAHLVPYWNRKKNPPEREVQLIIDYKGLVSVVRRSPSISVVRGNVARENDVFEYEEGSRRIFRHRPSFSPRDQNAKILFAYSFVKFANIDDWEVDILPIWRIEEVRSRSRAKDDGPWVTDYAEMAIKTALRHHSKTLPLRSEDRAAIVADDDQYEFDPWTNKRVALPQTTPKFDEYPKLDPQTPATESDTQRDQESSRDPAKAADDEGPGDRGEANKPKRSPGRPRKAKEEDQAPAQSTTVVPFSSEATGTEEQNQLPVAQAEDNSKERKIFTQRAEPEAVTELLRKINLAKVTQTEVIQALKYHDYSGIEKAVDSGLVSDFDDQTVKYVMAQWESVLFNILRFRRSNQLKELEQGETFP